MSKTWVVPGNNVVIKSFGNSWIKNDEKRNPTSNVKFKKSPFKFFYEQPKHCCVKMFSYQVRFKHSYIKRQWYYTLDWARICWSWVKERIAKLFCKSFQLRHLHFLCIPVDDVELKWWKPYQNISFCLSFICNFCKKRNKISSTR